MIATLASVSSATRLRSHLSNKYTISSRIIQTPSPLTKEGCGYSLVFDGKYKPIISKAAKEMRINIRSFFTEDTSGEKPIYIKE